jgi:hypothetical protein
MILSILQDEAYTPLESSFEPKFSKISLLIRIVQYKLVL